MVSQLPIALYALVISTAAADADDVEVAPAERNESVEDNKPNRFQADSAGRDDGVEVISILGDAESRQRIAGSAQRWDAERLERWEYDDIGRLLKQVPGVYIRDEDGFGLRPNIGLRGASSDRSRKIVLMEDGILIAPAPYSAPAGYYFPLITRATGVEVFKGPAAIRYGPNTVGGAINVLSRAVPDEPALLVDIAGGQRLFGRAHVAAGTSVALGSGRLGISLEGVHLRSDGFKELDNGGDTGFAKNEAVFKLRWSSDPTRAIYQWAELKLIYSDEESNETYLGLTDSDFTQTPDRRYSASQDDLMEFQRGAVQLSHVVEFGDAVEIRSSLYRSDLDRTWSRLATFGGQPLLDVVLSPPNPELEVLRGERNSNGTDEALGFVANDRVYYSMGAQTSITYRADWLDSIEQAFELGLRAHRDQVRRFHTDDRLLLVDNDLVASGSETEVTVHNVDRSTAYSLYLTDEIQWDTLTLTPGFRVENIEWRRRNRLTRALTSDRYSVFLPGIGAHLGLPGGFGVLAGVHRGFSAVAPDTEDAEPELSVNYEAGARWNTPTVQMEAVGFFNDYQNLTNICSFSGGCSDIDVDTQSSAGSVDVYGAELSARFNVAFGEKLTLGGGAAYTWTDSEFQDSFESSDPLLGSVDPGESLPYIPEHQASADLSLQIDRLGLNVAASYVGEMRETADEDDPLLGALRTEEQFIVDVGAEFSLASSTTIYARIDNVFDQQSIVSRRPLGARPGRPFTAFAGLRYRWGEGS
ncbi:MAG: TonB-dependent receptor [Myxococcota bacterium]